jgi:CDP-ribitol ribitolphosphotransferase
VLLFAPTFRGYGAKTATYDSSRVDVEALHALCVERDAVCLVRLHPFVREPLEIPGALRDRIVDASAIPTPGARPPIETNDLLFAVDLLITDYSSIVYEYSILGRPMLFFAYDLDDYVASRDFYEPYETFVPGRIVRTFDELLDAIRRDDYEQEKVAPFAQRHFDHLDGGSTDRVIELITKR